MKRRRPSLKTLIWRSGREDAVCEFTDLQKSEQERSIAVKKLEDEIERLGGVDNLTEETMPEAHIRGDVDTPYKCIGGAVYTMQRAGFARVGFISEPPPGGAGVTRRL